MNEHGKLFPLIWSFKIIDAMLFRNQFFELSNFYSPTLILGVGNTFRYTQNKHNFFRSRMETNPSVYLFFSISPPVNKHGKYFAWVDI